MASGDTLPNSSTLQTTPPRARDTLRRRAVLHEANVRDIATARAYARQSKRQRLILPSGTADSHPLLAYHLETHDGYPPPVTRNSRARRHHLEAMHSVYGPLVMFRLSLPYLDPTPLYSPEMSTTARRMVGNRMKSLLSVAIFTADAQRGADGGTHAHVCAPLAFTLDPYQQQVTSAPHGRGGGCELPTRAAHGVVIKETVTDRERVAGYVVRHPDGRLDKRSGLAYLDALEDELARKALHLPPVRLGWTRGVLPVSSPSYLSN